jgi:putative transposase
MTLAADYPTAVVCAAPDVPRSTFHFQGQPASEGPVRGALLQRAGRWPTYGYRRLTVMLRRAGWSVNAKRVRRLMHELGLVAQPPKRRVRTTDSRHDFPASRTW